LSVLWQNEAESKSRAARKKLAALVFSAGRSMQTTRRHLSLIRCYLFPNTARIIGPKNSTVEGLLPGQPPNHGSPASYGRLRLPKKIVMNRFFSFDLRQSSDIFRQDGVENGD
jgi:hypothetical protein